MLFKLFDQDGNEVIDNKEYEKRTVLTVVPMKKDTIVRYDFDIPRTERFDRLNWFDFGATSPIAGKVPQFPDLKGLMLYANGSRRSPYNGDYNNIQPRIGIAYALGKMKAYGIVDSGDAKANGIGALSDARWQTFFTVMADEGLYPKDLDFHKAYTLRFVNRRVGEEAKQ